MKKVLVFLNALLVLLSIACFTTQAKVIYVNHNPSSNGNTGVDWANAYADLQVAMDAAVAGDTLWVAAGTYKPTSAPDGSTADLRDRSFHLITNIKIFGGFAGTENELSQRDFLANETILSGDFDDNDSVIGIGDTLSISNNSDNAYHVFMLTSATSAILDGFTIKGGNANGSGQKYLNGYKFFQYVGGGIYIRSGNIQLSNLKIINNSASIVGGLFLQANARTVMTNVHIEKNVGNGLTATSQITLTNSTISGNKGRGVDVGGLNNSIIRNSVFSFNSNSGIYTNRNTTIVNCTFYGNSAAYGAGISIEVSSGSIIKNCIFWNNYASNSNGGAFSDVSSDYAPTVEYCLMQPETFYGTGTGSITNQNPLFVNAEQGDFRLLSGSPALDAGNNTAIAGVPTDIAGNDRIQNTTVDMGAYEGAASPSRVYVDSTAAGSGTGANWTDAYTAVQDAIDNPYGATEIWVAKGTYSPTQVPDGNTIGVNDITVRDKSFHLATDMKIYGGFAGTESLLSQRISATNITILSGDFNNDDVVTGGGSTLGFSGNTENAHHVMITANLSAVTVIDGFRIKGGNANGGGTINYESQTLSRSDGGGMYNRSSSPTLTNATLTNNNALYGGGMLNSSCSPTLTNATFTNNNAYNFGGGMSNLNSSSPTITNATFTNNNADVNGGRMYNLFSSSPTITNSIIWDNGSTEVTNNNSTPNFKNSIIKGSGGSGGFSGIGTDGGGNLDADPLFTDAANGDFTLLKCSPAINKGDNTAWTSTGLSTDAAGNARPFGTSVVDMGAYEFQGNNPFTNAIYVKHNALGNNDGSTWANAYTDLQEGIDNHCGSLPIWVTAGTYLPKDAPDGTTSTGLMDRNNAFHLASNMKIYGGFKGTETLFSERDWKANPTNLSGDFNGDDIVSGSGATLSITNNTENAYHIMITANLTSAAIIDGFQFKGGNANGVHPARITYQSSSILADAGGGLYNQSSNPRINHILFLRNYGQYGGGLYNSGTAEITNSNFIENLAEQGGGLFNQNADSKISNCTFSGNSATNWGGGMVIWDSSPAINNNTFVGNSAGSSFGGGAILNYNESIPIITNNIFWENQKGGADNVAGADIANSNETPSPVVTYSLTQENSLYNTGTGIINNQDPLFVGAANGILNLKCNSPAINQGTLTGAPKEDITGFTRVGNPDMGAYEYGYVSIDSPVADGSNLNITGIPQISSDAAIQNTNTILYEAANSVILSPGFMVAPTGGAATVFRAEIGGGCEYERE